VSREKRNRPRRPYTRSARPELEEALAKSLAYTPVTGVRASVSAAPAILRALLGGRMFANLTTGCDDRRR
jgi:hypothetical protein